MEETIALIDRIIEEHKQIMKNFKVLEQVANDAQALSGLEIAKEQFMPGRHDQKQGLQKLRETLETVHEGLQSHFNREETTLLTAIEKHGNKAIISALHTLLLEHGNLRDRFTNSKQHVAELISGGLSRHIWEASAHDMRAHLSHSQRLLAAHAKNEEELLHKLKRVLMGAGGNSSS